jgi:hypothetical protein
MVLLRKETMMFDPYDYNEDEDPRIAAAELEAMDPDPTGEEADHAAAYAEDAFERGWDQ